MRYRAENFDVWQYLCGMTYEPMIRLRIDFGGMIDEERLKRAVTKSMGTIPMMGCCFEGEGRKPYWVDKGFSGEDMVRVREVGTDAEAEILDAYASRIDVGAEPQLKMNIVRTPDGDTLCAVLSHLVCDATGFKQYVHLVADIYTALAQGEQPPTPHRYPRRTKPLYTNTGFWERMKILRSPEPAHDYALADQPGIDFHGSEQDTYMEYRTLSTGEFASLRGFAKAHGGTLNDALMALFARAYCRETGTDHIAFTSTIDWRRYIPPEVPYGITNYAGNCSCGIPVKPGESLEATLARITQQMSVYKTGKLPLQSALAWDWAMRVFPYSLVKSKFTTAAPMARVSFTNLGILDPDKWDFDGLPIRTASMTASIKPRPYLQLTASTFDGTCTLSCNIDGSEQERTFVDRMLDDIVRDASG